MYNVLICDDDKDIRNALEIYLSGQDYRIFKAENGEGAIKILKENEIHLVLLDIMMPGMDGRVCLTKIREFSNVPVIFLTAMNEETDIIMGLGLGADDYITKPFNALELTARVASHIRRYDRLGGMNKREEQDVLRVAGLEMNDAAKIVMLDGNAVNLTKTEYEILKLLMSHPGQVYSPEQIYENIWNEECLGGESTVAVHIRHLREKIEYDPGKPRYLKVVWGHGYKIEN